MEPKYKPQAKYDKENSIQVKLKLNRKTDSDILEIFESISNKNGYLKALIRADQVIKKDFKKEEGEDD